MTGLAGEIHGPMRLRAGVSNPWGLPAARHPLIHPAEF